MPAFVTQGQNDEFGNVLLKESPLDDAIDWINSNLSPHDVFTEGQLETWATENGFVRNKE
ncbi:hypothetical protein [Leptospira weilii]|uniref:hypothetical protein n=1 Tax=Leptospira weilii TaxID=28184 RepID=UPI00077479CB|nr:hypothetical protein [Leptospira weilii]